MGGSCGAGQASSQSANGQSLLYGLQVCTLPRDVKLKRWLLKKLCMKGLHVTELLWHAGNHVPKCIWLKLQLRQQPALRPAGLWLLAKEPSAASALPGPHSYAGQLAARHSPQIDLLEIFQLSMVSCVRFVVNTCAAMVCIWEKRQDW